MQNTIWFVNKETQITLVLKGIEAKRPYITDKVAEIIRISYGDDLVVTVAGSKSIDIRLALISKAHAVSHLIRFFPEFSSTSDKMTLIAEDSFHAGGADNELLHPSLQHAIVFCAGESIPQSPGFAVIQTKDPSSLKVYEFLKEKYGLS